MWHKGTVYNPRDGKTYKAIMKLKSDEEIINNNIATYGYKISSTRYDCGTPKGLSEASYNLSKLI